MLLVTDVTNNKAHTRVIYFLSVPLCLGKNIFRFLYVRHRSHGNFGNNSKLPFLFRSLNVTRKVTALAAPVTFIGLCWI